ncbi:hypothetical protein POX_h09780 [Penicillium oxalicum]|uniref:hypothetical protein n=1 Tax=Penicillium oxalicum TaxID=69781 RepID=UPI0020B741CF|nr:hypothetical protein POX_h09780 [Penicillium oxalicum]KAI2786015.1 hypothetical protein POX_h09780 [Penicillium oxalicum]
MMPMPRCSNSRLCIRKSRRSGEATGLLIIAGSLCVMALVFNICALASGWLESVSDAGSTLELSTPEWAIALKSISLAFAGVSYLFYLLLIAIQSKTPWGYLVTVAGLLIAAAALFSLIGIEIRRHQRVNAPEVWIYTQNFFAAVFAACIYVLASVLLIPHVLSLSYRSQRGKVVQCTSIMFRLNFLAVFLLGGAAIYSRIEGWTLMDSLYFTDYTVLTIGIGNIVPQTHLGRSLLFPYATLGIISLGLVVTAVMSVTDQMRELRLSYVIERVRGGADSKDDNDKLPSCQISPCRPSFVRHATQRYQEFLKEQAVRSQFYRRTRWTHLIVFVAAWFILWLVSAVVFRHSEKESNWTYFVALYFTYTSLTTIGYGDYFPTSNFGKVFFIFWSLLAIPILTNLVTLMGAAFHAWLRDCSSWARKRILSFKGSNEHDHELEHYSRLIDQQTQGPVSQASCETGVEKRPANLSSSHRNLRSVQADIGLAQSTPDEPSRSAPGGTSAYRQLILLQEIQDLIGATREDVHEGQESLCCRWSKILPLLQAAGTTDDLGDLVSLFATVKAAKISRRVLGDHKQEREDRNIEILWMISLLVERLSADLRQELAQGIE